MKTFKPKEKGTMFAHAAIFHVSDFLVFATALLGTYALIRWGLASK